MPSTASPLLSAPAMARGLRALQSGLRVGLTERGQNTFAEGARPRPGPTVISLVADSLQPRNLASSGYRSRVGYLSSSTRMPGQSRPYSATPPSDDDGVLELPEPRRPHNRDIDGLDAPDWSLPLDAGPKTRHESDEYASSARVRNALFRLGPDAALRTYTSAPAGTVLLNLATIHGLVQALLTPTRGRRPIPAPTHITAAADVMTDQLRHHLNRPVALPPGFHSVIVPAMQILAALSTSAAVPRRWERVDGILHLMQRWRFPLSRRDPNRVITAAACYRTASHTGAIFALATNTWLSSADWKYAIGLLGRTRFNARSFMSADNFLRFLKMFEASGGEVDAGLFISYVKALAIVVASIRQPDEQQALADHGVERREVFRSIRDTLHTLEHEILPRYPACAPDAVSVQLLKMYLHLPHRDADIFRCWAAILRAPPPVRARAAAAISGFPPDSEVVARLWEDLLASDTSDPAPGDWDLFERALQRGGAYAETVNAIFVRFVADPGLSAAEPAEDSVTALCKHVPLPETRVRSVLKYLGRAQTRKPSLFPVLLPTSRPVRT